MGHNSWLDTFISVYGDLETNNLALLEKVYHRDIHFSDPMHEVHGLNDLIAYFGTLYTNLDYCRFQINHVINDNNDAAVYWTMFFSHPKLNRGEEILVEGNSFLTQKDNKVIRHRDYLDLGAMLYEHIPFLGSAIKTIKKRASR